MGLSAGAWWKMMARHRFHLPASAWPAALFDLACGLGNSTLGVGQSLLWNHRLRQGWPTQDPIFVVGHWRTGTTLLHELLTLDPALRSPTTYECLAPHHFLLTGRWLPRLTRFTLPQTRAFDGVRVGWDAPQEDEFALCNLGLPSPYAAIAFPHDAARDDAALDLEQLSPRERRQWRLGFERLVRQWTCFRPGRLLLKSPTHTFRVPLLAEMFPQARWILLVRNPWQVFPSTLKLWRTLYATYAYQAPPFPDLEPRVIDLFARMHQRWTTTSRQLAPGLVTTVRYEDLVQNPTATIQQVYQQLNLGHTDSLLPAVERYFADRADYRPNRHQLDAAWIETIQQRWRDYFAAYGYPLQPPSTQ
ncbi:MAG: sulfotransferase [Pirellulales bacterium]